MKRVGSLSRFKSTGSLVRRLEVLDEQTSSTALDADDLAARLRSFAVAASFDKPSRIVRVRRRAVAFFAAIGVFGWVGITGAAASVGLAATGNLPAPIQNTVSNVLDVVGIDVPRSEPDVPEAPVVPDTQAPVDQQEVISDAPSATADEVSDSIREDSRSKDGIEWPPAVPNLIDALTANADDAPGGSESTPVRPTTPPGLSGTSPGQSGTAPGQGGTTPGQSGSAPGQSGSAPGQVDRDDNSSPGQSGSSNSNAGGNSSSSNGNSGSSNAGGNSDSSNGNSGSSNAGGNSSSNSGNSNAGGNGRGNSNRP